MKITHEAISAGKIARMSEILLISEHTQKSEISDETGGCSAWT